MSKHWWLAALLGLGLARAEELPTVAVSQIIDHPALNDSYAGLREALEQEGLQVRYDYENAQGNSATALQIAEKFAGNGPKAVVAIGTPAAQALANTLNGSVPLVFVAVTDPVAAKLVSAWDKTDGNITGTSDAVPVALNLDLIQELLPTAKRIGTIYNAGEANSVAAVAALKEALRSRQLELVEAPATKTSEVQEAAASLLGQVDVIYLVQDNVVISAIKAVVQTGEENKLPVFAADAGSVRAGAIGSRRFDYREVGRSAGQQLAAILKGQAVKDIPVRSPAQSRLILNPAAAQKMGVAIPEALRSQAQELIP